MKKFVASIVIALLVVNFGFSQNLQKSSENSVFKKGKLLNGMEYYIQPNSEITDRVTVGLLVKAGSCMEEEDQRGVAHLIEHMCFNSTENYKMYEFQKYIESIGMDFWKDCNANTSYDRTFYYITIPTTNDEYLEKAMLWLNDIASGKVLFLENELQKEKGIVIEEWRRLQGYSARYDNAIVNEYHLKNTIYAERDALGTEQSITDVSLERIQDFYKKWYRSDNMAFIVAGDIEPAAMEKVIKNNFSKLKKPKGKLPKVDLSIPEQGDGSIVFCDVENKDSAITIEKRLENVKYKTADEQTRSELLRAFVTDIYSMNISGTSRNINSAVYSAGMNVGYVKNYRNLFVYINIRPKENMVEQALKEIKNAFVREKTFGVTERGLNIYKKNYSTKLTRSRENVIKKTNVDYCYLIINSILYDYFYIPAKEELEKKIEFLETFTLEEVNKYIADYFPADGDFICFTCNENNRNGMTPEKLQSTWFNCHPAVVPYTEENLPETLMERPEKKAELKLKTKNKELGITEYVLENGATIITKKTDYEKNKIYMVAMSNGGASMYEDNEYSSACACVNYFNNSGINGFTNNQFQTIKAGQYYEASCSLYLNYEGINGNSNNKDFENMLQYIYLVFTNPNFNEQGWNKVYQNYIKSNKSRISNRNDVFNKELFSTIHGDEIRHQYGICDEFIETLDKKRSEEIFRERFSNAADFIFYFVGDFDEKNLIDLCCYYIGNIPGDEKMHEDAIARKNYFPEGKTFKVVKSGKDSSVVYIAFADFLEIPDDPYERRKTLELFSSIKDYFKSKISDEIREEKSGTYTITGDISLYQYPVPYYSAYFYFVCEPGREEELKDCFFEKLKQIKETGISDEDMNNLKKNKELGISQQKESNNYWLNRLLGIYFYQNDLQEFSLDTSKILEFYTKENIDYYFDEIFDEENNVVMFLVPEEE